MTVSMPISLQSPVYGLQTLDKRTKSKDSENVTMNLQTLDKRTKSKDSENVTMNLQTLDKRTKSKDNENVTMRKFRRRRSSQKSKVKSR